MTHSECSCVNTHGNCKILSLCVRKQTIWVPTRSDTNRAVQSQKQARGLKFWLEVEEELYYPCSENKGADQLCSYCTADLCLCFCLSILLVFSCSGLNNSRLAHSADVYNLHGAKRLVTITNVLSASCPSVNQDGENKPFLHIDCFT